VSGGYWRRLYGKRSQDFIDGVIAGVEAYAVWKDGEQLVGVARQPLAEAIKEIQEELGGGK